MTIHTKQTFRNDLKYARQVMRQIEEAISSGQWDDIEDAANELSGTFASMTQLAEDNKNNIKDFGCKYEDEIKEIRAEQKEMTDREHDLALNLLPLDGYMAYLNAREDGNSHMYAMSKGWNAHAVNNGGVAR